MEIIHFNDPVRFQSEIQSYLERHEAENNLVLGILAGVIAGEYREIRPYLALMRDGDGILGAAMCTPPYPALLSYRNPAPAAPVLKAWLDDLALHLEDDFTGVSGNKEFVTPLVAAWERLTGKPAVLQMALRIYKLEEVRPVPGVPGQLRPAEEADRELLLEWYAGFHRDSMAEEPDPRHVRRQVKTYLEADPRVRGMLLWEVNGIPVSMVGYAGPTPHGIRVGAVYTPPDQRRKGYASACTAGVSQHLLDRGYQFCFLFTDLQNPTSNHIYQQIGYQPVCDVDRYLF